MKYIGLFDEKEDIVTKEKLDAVETAIPTKTSQLDNDSGFITSAPVTSVNAKTGAVILSASDVGAQPTITVDGIIKSDGAGNLSAQETVAAELVDLPTVPTKVSELTNDSGYITAAQAPVQSVNNKTGAVQLNASDVGALPADTVIPTVNNATLTIKRNSIDVGSFTDNAANDVNIDINVPTNKSDIGLGNVDNVKQYSDTNPPPYPVTSVNGKTGAVSVNVPSASSTTPKAPGTASAGSESAYARGDHVHPKQTVTKTDVGLGNVDNVSINTRLNRTTNVNASDSNYTTYMARGEALFSTETTPSVNGCIAWQYG